MLVKHTSITEGLGVPTEQINPSFLQSCLSGLVIMKIYYRDMWIHKGTIYENVKLEKVICKKTFTEAL